MTLEQKRSMYLARIERYEALIKNMIMAKTNRSKDDEIIQAYFGAAREAIRNAKIIIRRVDLVNEGRALSNLDEDIAISEDAYNTSIKNLADIRKMIDSR